MQIYVGLQLVVFMNRNRCGIFICETTTKKLNETKIKIYETATKQYNECNEIKTKILHIH